jgi:hypothetical protein
VVNQLNQTSLRYARSVLVALGIPRYRGNVNLTLESGILTGIPLPLGDGNAIRKKEFRDTKAVHAPAFPFCDPSERMLASSTAGNRQTGSPLL